LGLVVVEGEGGFVTRQWSSLGRSRLAIGDAWSELLEVSRRAVVVSAIRRGGAVAVRYDAPVPRIITGRLKRILRSWPCRVAYVVAECGSAYGTRPLMIGRFVELDDRPYNIPFSIQQLEDVL
jgi:hypothetical protein